MHHSTPLIATIVGGLVLAFIFGAVAQRLRMPPLVGYLLGGVLIGPNTPGFVADQSLASELAELGVILLMFGVGLHFSLKDLLAVRKIAVPGAVVQIAVATAMGAGLAWFLGWPIGGGLVFGLSLSVASTVVLLRAMQDRRLLETDRGRIAVGWLIVEDLAMVLALVLIPAFADALSHGGAGLSAGAIAGTLAITIGKVIAFVAVMLIVGRRVIPRILDWVAATGSRELFTLAVLAVALGVALGAAYLFDVSFALGAFFAGMILAESPLSHRAAEESLPLRDAFAVLFFVSVGMLFDPSIVLRAPLQLIATLAIILVGKSIAAFFIVRAFGHSRATAMTIAASLAQIGEFSFILAGLGLSLNLMPQEGQDLILAGAILSILFNPVAFAIAERKQRSAEPLVVPAAAPAALPAPEVKPEGALKETSLHGHAIVVGYGRVGSHLAHGLKIAGAPYLVIEDREKPANAAHADGAELLLGNGAEPRVLKAANLAGASHLFVAIPQSFEAGQVVKQARKANPELVIVARAHSDAEVAYLQQCGANVTVMGEREIAQSMLETAVVPAVRREDPALL